MSATLNSRITLIRIIQIISNIKGNQNLRQIMIDNLFRQVNLFKSTKLIIIFIFWGFGVLGFWGLGV